MAPATPPPCSSRVLAALAMASTSRVVMSVSRTSTVAVTRPRLRHFRWLVLALEALAAALDGGDELREVDLERVEDLVGVVLRAEADLALASAGVLDDVLGGALGLLGDLLLGGQLRLALAGLLEDPLGLALGLGQHLLTLLDDPARLLDLLGDRGAHLVEDVVDLLLVHAHGVRERNRLCVVDEVVQLVDQYQDVHLALRSLPPQRFLQAAGHLFRYESRDVAAEGGDLLDSAGGQKTVLRARHQVDGLHVGGQRAVELVHLQLVLEIRDRSQSLDDGLGALIAREVDDELVE